MSLSYSGLPQILSERLLRQPYNPVAVSRLVWQTSRWWLREAERAWRDAIDNLDAERLEDVYRAARLAMHVHLFLGGWSATRHGNWARQHRGKRLQAPHIIKLALDWRSVRAGVEEWNAFGGERYDEYKERVYRPLYEQMAGMPREFATNYVDRRLPPIRRTTDEARRRVGDAVAAGELAGDDAETIRERLQEIGDGRWGRARTYNQVRTETSALFNSGRFRAFEGNPDVTGYEFQATLDDRTTPYCEHIHGRRVKADAINAVPPFHYQCRTIMLPVFDWEKQLWDDPLDPPGEGEWQEGTYQGFGMRDELRAMRGQPDLPRAKTQIDIPTAAKRNAARVNQVCNWRLRQSLGRMLRAISADIATACPQLADQELGDIGEQLVCDLFDLDPTRNTAEFDGLDHANKLAFEIKAKRATGRHQQIKMGPHAKARKEAWLKANKGYKARTVAVVVEEAESPVFGTLYMRDGYGSFRIASMDKAATIYRDGRVIWH